MESGEKMSTEAEEMHDCKHCGLKIYWKLLSKGTKYNYGRWFHAEGYQKDRLGCESGYQSLEADPKPIPTSTEAEEAKQEVRLCDTTMTPRAPRTECGCDTYPDNLGPCATYEEGMHVEHCVYCDHKPTCHRAHWGAASAPWTKQLLPPTPIAPRTVESYKYQSGYESLARRTASLIATGDVSATDHIARLLAKEDDERGAPGFTQEYVPH